MAVAHTGRTRRGSASMNGQRRDDKWDSVARTARSGGARDVHESMEGSRDGGAQAARVNGPAVRPQTAQGGKATIRSATSRA